MRILLTEEGLLRRTRDAHVCIKRLLDVTNLMDHVSPSQMNALRLAERELHNLRMDLSLPAND